MHKELRYEGEVAMRLDKFLAQSEPEFSRVQFQQLIANGDIFVNGEVQKKPLSSLNREALWAIPFRSTKQTR